MVEYLKSPIPRDQLTMWSQRLDDAVPPDHQVRFVEQIFHSRHFEDAFAALEAARRQKEGRPGYSPRVLAKLIIFGHLMRMRSSRQLETACREWTPMIWLMQGLTPDHATIARFMKQEASAIRNLLKASVRVAIDAKLVTLEMLAVDSTFIEANAARRSVRGRKQIRKELAQLDAVVNQMMEAFERNDTLEEATSRDRRVHTPNSSIPMKRRMQTAERKRKQLERALEQIEAREDEPRRAGQPAPNPVASVTDPDCRNMLDKEKRCKPNYNVQLAVDSKQSFIVAGEVNDQPNDTGQMKKLVDAAKENCGEAPSKAVFDAGYHTHREVAACEDLPTRFVVSDPNGRAYRQAGEARRTLGAGGRLTLEQVDSLPRSRHGCFDAACFVYDATTDSYRCPAGEVLSRRRKQTRYDRHGKIEGAQYGTDSCATCELACRCHRSKAGRIITRTELEDARERMLAHTLTEEGKEEARKRATTVEPRFGEMKSDHGFRRFLYRSQAKVASELTLLATALNVKRLVRWMQSLPGPMPAPP